MPPSTYTYNLDGAMTAASGEIFSSIRRHNYTRLPIEIFGTGGSSMALSYDSFGRRLHKTGSQAIFYRSGAHHPAADRTKELENGAEIHHTLVELVDGAEIVYIFTPAGQTILRRKDGYARIARDHLRSVRVELSSAAQITAHYSAYGKAIIIGGELRRAFAGYEPDAEAGLYNANRRLYAPTLRLFVSVDPQLQDASPYPYCAAEPFNNIDPTGEISAAVVNGIIAGLLLVVSIIVALVSEGFGTPVVAGTAQNMSVEAGTATATLAMEAPSSLTLTGEIPQEGGISGFLAAHMPRTAVEFAKFGAGFGFASTAVSNGAQLATQASNGEHITAWQAVRSMLIEPVIAAGAGAVGGFAGKEMSALAKPLRTLGAAALSAAAASGGDSIASAALNGQITTRSGWETIGIQMAVAVGEALVMTPFFSSVPGLPTTTSRVSYQPPSLSSGLLSRSYGNVGDVLERLTPLERFKRFFRPKLETRTVAYSVRGVPQSRRVVYNLPDNSPPLAEPHPPQYTGARRPQ